MSNRYQQYHQYNMCLRKQGYSEAMAKEVAEYDAAKSGEPIEPYACIYCNEWHVGRSKKAKPSFFSLKCALCWHGHPHTEEIHDKFVKAFISKE